MIDELSRTINGTSVSDSFGRSVGRRSVESTDRVDWSIDRPVDRSKVLWWLVVRSLVRSFGRSFVWLFIWHFVYRSVGRSNVGRSVTRSVNLSVVCSVGGLLGLSVGRLEVGRLFNRSVGRLFV